jgi:hypothetical protein
LPVRRWACVEWHLGVASNELQFWIDGKPITHVEGRAGRERLPGNDLQALAAPAAIRQPVHRFERYADYANDQNLWIDDVALATAARGCPQGNVRRG